jgi:putative endonuclease
MNNQERKIKTSETGKKGERLACKYLEKNGYRILDRNYWKPWGEIDIVAQAKNKTLVFVEVKAMRQSNPEIYEKFTTNIAELTPEDNLTSFKLKKIQRTARGFVTHSRELVDEEKGWRIDLIAISLYRSGEFNLRHYENL